jgi:type I restriction-modification system DNA methylase subunit
MYLESKYLELKERDLKRFKSFKKEQLLLDKWSKYSFYDFLINSEERSERGSFYTPEWIVRLMVHNSFSILKKKGLELSQIKILEPSCGSGNFLQVIIEELHLETKKSYQQIVEENIYSLDIDSEAIKVSMERIEELFSVKLKNIYCEDALFFKEKEFDLIIGNPPYGNLLNKGLKDKLSDKYSNIALNFMDHFYDALSENGLLYFIVPHSFSRAGQGSLVWREKIIQDKSLYEIIDVGNPFFDITLEQIIVGLTKSKNEEVITNSIRYNQKGNIVKYFDIFDNNEKMISIYYDEIYENIKKSNPIYPFNGKRGKDFNKKELFDKKDDNNYWVILGKNISKSGVINVANYDKYSQSKEYVLDKEYVAITQFGINLKAALVPKDTIPSGGIVIIQHGELSQEEAINYLNKKEVNEYLQKYILNGAELTVHLDGKYLKQIPYTKLIQEK